MLPKASHTQFVSDLSVIEFKQFSHWIVPGRRQTTIASSMEDILLRFESFWVQRQFYKFKKYYNPQITDWFPEREFLPDTPCQHIGGKSISDVFNKMQNLFYQGSREGFWHAANDIAAEGITHTHKSIQFLTHITGVLRQGDGRGPANGDFISFLPWISWENDEHWYGLGKCLFIDADPVAGKPNRSGMWNDATCSHRYKYICERTVPPQM